MQLGAEQLSGLGGRLLDETADARSYDGQYAPWVQSLVEQSDHDIRRLAEEARDLGQRLAEIAQAFEQADHEWQSALSPISTQTWPSLSQVQWGAQPRNRPGGWSSW